jgi:protoheme ferro-lyase
LREQADLVVKVNYVKKFPKDQKYISVFKENVEHATTKKNQMMEQIAERVLD